MTYEKTHLQAASGNINNLVQAINLSPKDILVRFRDMEAKLPPIADFKLYSPTFRFFVNNDDDEAKTCSSVPSGNGQSANRETGEIVLFSNMDSFQMPDSWKGMWIVITVK